MMKILNHIFLAVSTHSLKQTTVFKKVFERRANDGGVSGYLDKQLS
jgi:hypothetical protein